MEEAVWCHINESRAFNTLAPLARYHEKFENFLVDCDDILPMLLFLVKLQRCQQAVKVLVHYTEVQVNSGFVRTLEGHGLEGFDVLRVSCMRNSIRFYILESYQMFY